MNLFKKIFKKEEPTQEYFDMREFLEYVQSSSDWVEATFKEEQVDMDDELIYMNQNTGLAFKFIIDEETNTVGMRKIETDMLEVKSNKKSM